MLFQQPHIASTSRLYSCAEIVLSTGALSKSRQSAQRFGVLNNILLLRAVIVPLTSYAYDTISKQVRDASERPHSPWPL